MSVTETITPQHTGQSESAALTSTAESLAVTVLMGGPSSERQISLKSGKAVAEALEQMGHDVVRADIGPNDLAALQREGLDVVFPASILRSHGPRFNRPVPARRGKGAARFT